SRTARGRHETACAGLQSPGTETLSGGPGSQECLPAQTGASERKKAPPGSQAAPRKEGKKNRLLLLALIAVGFALRLHRVKLSSLLRRENVAEVLALSIAKL